MDLVEQDRRFAALVVKIGLVPDEVAQECLELARSLRERGEDARVAKVLCDRGALSNAALVPHILEIQTALGEFEDASPPVLPRLGRILLQNDFVPEDRIREALDIQASLKSQGLAMLLGDILLERSWLDPETLKVALSIQERLRETGRKPAHEDGSQNPLAAVAPHTTAKVPGGTTEVLGRLLPGASEEDRAFARLALAGERVGRLQIRDAREIQLVYARHKVAKSLSDVIEELQYLSPEETGSLREKLAERNQIVRPVAARPTPSGPDSRIAELALENGLVTERMLDSARLAQRDLARTRLQRPIGLILVEMGVLSARDHARLAILARRREAAESGPRPALPDRRSRRRWLAPTAVLVLAGTAGGVSLAIRLVGSEGDLGATPAEAGDPSSEARDRDLERSAFDVAMAGRGLVEFGGERWIEPEERARLLEEERSSERLAEGQVFWKGRWYSPEAFEHELAREADRRLGLVLVEEDLSSPLAPANPSAPEAGLAAGPPVEFVDLGDAFEIEAVHESQDERIRVAGRGRVPDDTAVRIVLAGPDGPFQERICRVVRGGFGADFGGFARPLFPGVYRVRAEVDRELQTREVGAAMDPGPSRFATERELHVRPELEEEESSRARDEIESAVESVRFLVREAGGASALADPGARADKTLVLEERLVSIVRSLSADSRWIEAPYRSARSGVRELAGVPWFDRLDHVRRLERNVDQVLVELAREDFAALPGLEREIELARSVVGEVAEPFADLSPTRAQPREIPRSAYVLVRSLARRHEDLVAASARIGSDPGQALRDWKRFSGPWLADLFSDHLAARHLGVSSEASRIEEATGLVARCWLARSGGTPGGSADPGVDEKAAAAIRSLEADFAGLATVESILDGEYEAARELLAAVGGAAKEGDTWARESGDLMGRILEGVATANRLLRESDSNRARSLLVAFGRLLEYYDAEDALRRGVRPETPRETILEELGALLGR